MTTDITITLPIYIRVGKGVNGRFSLNLNTYRNAHFHTLNKAKTLFEEMVSNHISHLSPMTKVDLSYSLFFGSKRTIDISNICCVVDKFFCDTLVNQNKLIDDNMDSISKVTYEWGGVDKKDPRIEVTLSNIQLEKDSRNMQIILTQQEVEDAIRESVLQQITIREDQGISISFSGIKEGSFAVNVLIQKIDETNAPKKRAKRAIQPEESLEEPAKVQTMPVDEQTLSQPILAQEGDPATQISQATPKIFPDINSSAPSSEPTSSGTGKSLFAAFTKPVHDAAKEQ